MAIPSDPRRSISQQTDMFLFKLREYRNYADSILNKINGDNGAKLTGIDLSYALNALIQVKADLVTLYKSNVRGRLLLEYPVDYPDVATRNSKIALATTAVNSLITECSNLIALVASQGQIINANESEGLIDSVINPPESDALKAAAISVQNEIEDANLNPVR